MRKFEKISFEQFKKDIKEDKKLYDSYELPVRKTKHSAGYDCESLFDFVLKPEEIQKIPLGIKATMNENEMLLMTVRSSMGFKYNVRLTNQIGIIDADYYDNSSNEGHLYISLQNQGSKNFVVHKGDSICQGIFTEFLTVDHDETDTVRLGGLGSTSKEDKLSE